jgi:GNAT superfamily N-acetyltransferase
MDFVVLGWPADEPTLRLDHEQFSYAGKFVMSQTGKTVVRDDDGSILAAVAFDPDRTDPDTLRLRYVTVRADRRGEGIGPLLLRFTAERALERGYGGVCIAVNNPFAYEAAYRAGFAFTGESTGIAELVCAYGADRGTETYQAGLDCYRERDLSAAERDFLADRENAAPPAVVDDPT